MNITNEEQQDTPMLTKGDLVMASYALAEVFNSFLASVPRRRLWRWH